MATHHTHARKASTAHKPRASQHDALPSPVVSKLPRTISASTTATSTPTHSASSTVATPNPPSLLRLPSSGYHAIPISAIPPSPGNRIATHPSSPTHASSSSSTNSPSYFAPQSSSHRENKDARDAKDAKDAKDGRSPGSASRPKPRTLHSGNGIDASRGPPNSLITRGNIHVARRSQPSQPSQPTEFALGKQASHGSLISSAGAPPPKKRRGSDGSVASSTVKIDLKRQQSTGTVKRDMAPSVDGTSDHGSTYRSVSEEPRIGFKSRFKPTVDVEQEDLFIAAASAAGASASRPDGTDASTRAERLRSRIATRSYRQSFPSSSADSGSSTPRKRSVAGPEPAASTPQKRVSPFTFSSTSRMPRDSSPLSPPNPLENSRVRHQDSLSPKASFSTQTKKDSDLSPHQFLSQLSIRRPSYPGTPQATPNRTATYKPSNLHYSSSRDISQENANKIPETPRFDSFTQDNAAHVDGTESLDSTGPAASVWDELDELKSRIRRIELTGKLPATSAAVVANASGDRPRTANTSVTTVSSSPKQVRKADVSPAASSAGVQGPHRVHPLLKEALAKAKQHVSPPVYRVLEATATEAISLAELAGSTGPQGTLHSTSSILSGASLNDRQVRRKADNICRNLTELCIEMCDTKSTYASPAIRTAAISGSRRPSVQVNGDSPSLRASIEPESDVVPRSSPSRAMSRIEARRASLHTTKINGGIRENSAEPATPSAVSFSTRLSRAGTALQQRTRRASSNDDEDDDPTLRAPSRAMTDFRDIQALGSGGKRYSREPSHEPMPELQPSPSLQYPSSIRRPTATTSFENTPLTHRDSTRQFSLGRSATVNLDNRISHERLPSASTSSASEFKSRLAQPSTSSQYGLSRSSTVTSNVGRSNSGSFKRRLRGNSAGE